jgi:hypothetical protein
MAQGGARPGAGRPKGSRDAATKAQQATISDIARRHTVEAVEALLDVMRSGSDSARVAAANSILDRGYGKPVQAVEHTGKDGEALPFTGFLIERASQPDTLEPE